MRAFHRVLVLVFLAPTITVAHVGEVVFPVFELPTSQVPDTTDGTLQDWEAGLPLASLTHEAFVSFHYRGAVEPRDLAFRAFLGWNHARQRIFAQDALG